MTNKAIVTLLIGKYYQNRWKKYCASTWQTYAYIHNYDIICIDTALDNSVKSQSRSPAWQKCLILGDERVCKYDRVVWIDSDIVINPNSPCIFKDIPEEKIGAADAFEQFSQSLTDTKQTIDDKVVNYLGWKFSNPTQYYLTAQLPSTFERVVQTGVMVLSPKYHRSLFEYTYYNYSDTPVGDFEMESLSYEIMNNNQIFWISSKFNLIWMAYMFSYYPFLLSPKTTEIRPIRIWKRLTRGHYKLPPSKITSACLTTAFMNSYFLHFAGTSFFMPKVNTNIEVWSELLNTFK